MKKFLMVALTAMTMMVAQAGAATLNGTVSFAGNIITPVAAGDNALSFSVVSNPDTIGVVFLSTGDLTVPTFSAVTAPVQTLTTANANGFTINFANYTFVANSYSGATLVNGTGNALSVVLHGTFSNNSGTGDGTVIVTFQDPQTIPQDTYSGSGSTVPEPSTYAMLGSALLGLGLLRRRK